MVINIKLTFVFPDFYNFHMIKYFHILSNIKYKNDNQQKTIDHNCNEYNLHNSVVWGIVSVVVLCSMSCIRTKLALANKGSVTTVFRRIIHLAKHDYTQIISQTLSNIWIKYSEDTDIITVRILVNYQKQILMVIIKYLCNWFIWWNYCWVVALWSSHHNTW